MIGELVEVLIPAGAVALVALVLILTYRVIARAIPRG
jgi:hypothetical protein